VPVIYCTDLFHPHDDPDDHFDLATIFALQAEYGIEIKGIVLDQGRKQMAQPGRIPVHQMNVLTGSNVPSAIGLAEKLRNPQDTGEDQPEEFQAGIELIFKILERSQEKVKIITVGSTRDVTAAFNRRPGLFREKVDCILSFIGECSNPAYQEYNVSLDPHAYVGLMQSKLPVYWVPCFDGGLWKNGGRASFWIAEHADLLGNASESLQQFFLFCLNKPDADPIQYLKEKPDPEELERMLSGKRNLWCTVIFAMVKDLYPFASPEGFVLAEGASRREGYSPLYEFSPLTIRLGSDGRISEEGAPITVMTFRILDRERYSPGMTELTSEFLQSKCFRSFR
jgi:hypothetical protein